MHPRLDLDQARPSLQILGRNTLSASVNLGAIMVMNNKSRAAAQPVLRPTAAVSAHSGVDADQAIDAVVHSLQQRGVRVVGLRQRVSDNGTSRCGVELESISTGRLHRMTQSLGSGSISCNVDAEAMEQLALLLRDELNDDVDLVVINRFGKRESEGAGFCSVIERAIELGIPALTVVKEDWLDTWLDYGGEFVMTLPIDPARILNWFGDVSEQSHATSGTMHEAPRYVR